MEKITRRAMELARCYGAVAVGVATVETLEGGPPSTDLSYVLPNARSAIMFAAVSPDCTNPVSGRPGHPDAFPFRTKMRTFIRPC
jgi:hypothetical protein